MHPCTPSAVILPMERESSTFCSLLLPPSSLYGANHQPLLSPRPSVVTKNKLFFLSLLPPPTLSMNCLHFWINSLFSLRQPFWVLKHRKVLKQTSISCPFQPPQPRRRHNWYVYEPDFAKKMNNFEGNFQTLSKCRRGAQRKTFCMVNKGTLSTKIVQNSDLPWGPLHGQI